MDINMQMPMHMDTDTDTDIDMGMDMDIDTDMEICHNWEILKSTEMNPLNYMWGIDDLVQNQFYCTDPRG
jgi:hypothetical protein